MPTAPGVPNPVPEYINRFLLPLIGSRMIELGQKQTDGVAYKTYFEAIGFEHVSIDWQGRFDSLPLDLRQPIEHLPPADMVTNFGTTEHVSHQVGVWENVHRFVKPGGVLVSMCPMPGDWWWHGTHYPTEEFYRQFAERNGYRVDYLAVGREAPYRNIDARLVKVDEQPFQMPDLDTLFTNQMRRR